MRDVKKRNLLQAVLVSLFSLFALGFNHINIAKTSMSGMEGMAHESMSGIQCQVLCTTAINSEENNILFDNVEDKDPLPAPTFSTTIILSLLAVGFAVRYLYLSSSWRPPDKVLLYGHYSDGL